MANFFDQFDAAPQSAPPPQGGGNFFDQFDSQAPDGGGGLVVPLKLDAQGRVAAPDSTAMDVAKSAGTGLIKGAAGVADAPASISRFADWLPAYIGAHVGQALGVLPAGKTAADLMAAAHTLDDAPGTTSVATPGDSIVRAADKAGLIHQPQTTAGKYAETIGEMAPAAVGGEGSVASRLVKYAVAPGVASQAAGDVAAQVAPSLEPAARLVAAVATGGIGAALAPKTAGSVIQKAFEDVPVAQRPQLFADANSLMQDAADRGVTLTRAEAIQQASQGATRLGDAQRLVESTGRLRPMMAARPGQVEAAGRDAVGTIAPSTAAPSEIGPAVGDAATGTVNDTRTAADQVSGINQVQGPLATPPGLIQRPAVEQAMSTTATAAANEGKPLAVVTRDANGKVVTNQAVQALQTGARQRLDTALGQAFGDGGQIATADKVMAARKAAADPLYEEARSATIPDEMMPIDLLRRLKASGAFQQAVQKMRIDGQPFDIGGVQSWDYMKRALDDRIGAAVRKGANDDVRIYTGLKNELVNALDDAVPVYGQARDAFAGHSEMLGALQSGRDAAANAVTREQVARDFAALTDGQKAMYRVGFGNALREKLANAGNEGALPKAVAGSGAIRAKIARILPPNKAAALSGALAQEDAKFTTALAPDAQAWMRSHSVLADRAETASGAAQGVPAARDAVRQALSAHPDADAALTLNSSLRDQYLAPLLNGPIGKLAQKDITTQQAIDVLFPRNPIPNSETEVLHAVKNLSAKNPWAARQIVRSYAEGLFNKTTKDNVGGPNQFGGAKFAKELAGNPQVAANFDAALRALPNGDAIAPGFARFIEIMQATGQRQPLGSLTAFNKEALDTMKSAGAMKTGLAVAAGAGFKWPQVALDKFRTWRLGKNLDQLADLLVNPEAGQRFRDLAMEPVGSAKARALTARLAVLAGEGIRHRTRTAE